LFLFVLLFSVTFTRKKVLYEDFKELSTAEGSYYSTYEDDKALLEALILLMEQNATINFQISKTYFKW
jgi:hypothetical protein